MAGFQFLLEYTRLGWIKNNIRKQDNSQYLGLFGKLYIQLLGAKHEEVIDEKMERI